MRGKWPQALREHQQSPDGSMQTSLSSMTQQCLTSFVQHLHSTRYNNSTHIHPRAVPGTWRALVSHTNPRNSDPSLTAVTNTEQTTISTAWNWNQGFKKHHISSWKAANWALNEAQQLHVSPAGGQLQLHQKFRHTTAFSAQLAKSLLWGEQLLGSLWGKRLNKHTGGWGYLECTWFSGMLSGSLKGIPGQEAQAPRALFWQPQLHVKQHYWLRSQS